MSFMDLSASTSQQPRNNQMNFDSTATSFGVICENQSEFLLDSNKVVKFPRSTLNNDCDTRHMDICFDYNKSFGNTFQYIGNNFGYDGENAYGLNTTSNQPFNNADSYSYHSTEPPHELLQNQTGKFNTNKN